MKKINFKSSKFRSALSIILAILLVVGIASAIVVLKPKNYEKIGSSNFVIGKLTSDGGFAESDDYLCTSELIGCDDLTVTPKYDCQSSFQVFFYDFKFRYVSNTDVLTEKYEYLGSNPFVEYCRILILPSMDGQTEDEFRVSIFNKTSFVDDFDITVNKEQVIGSYENCFEKDAELVNMRVSPKLGTGESISYVDCEGVCVSKHVDLTDVKYVYFETDIKVNTAYTFFGLNSVDKVVSTFSAIKPMLRDGVYVSILDCRDIANLDSLLIHYDLNANCRLYTC